MNTAGISGVVYGPLMFYTDNCCKEAEVIFSVWGDLACRLNVNDKNDSDAQQGVGNADETKPQVNDSPATKIQRVEPGVIHVISNAREVAPAIRDLRNSKDSVLGFDMEWKVRTRMYTIYS